MRRFLLISVLAAISLSAGSKELPFRSGEIIDFTLKYKWGAVNTSVGEASIFLDSLNFGGKPAYQAQLTARSASFFDILYKIREHFHGWFTADERLVPLKYIRETLEGDYSAYNHYIYDWSSRQIHAEVSSNGEDPRKLDIPLKDDICDLPRMLYRFRQLEPEKMTIGQKVPIIFVIDDEIYDVEVTYLGDEKLKVRHLGYIQSHHFNCTVVSGAIFDGKTRLEFWLSADKNKLPLAMMAPLKFGRIWAWINSAKNTKYPVKFSANG